MYIKSVEIQNFKCFENQKIFFDPNFNLIIGENNSGKSTVFEAFRLWQLTIQQFYTARTYKKQSNIGFYKRYSYKALEISDLSFLRIQDINDVFFDKEKPFVIEVCFSNNKIDAGIPISFKRTSRSSLNCMIGFDKTGGERISEGILLNMSNRLFEVMGIANNDTFRNRIRLAYIPPKFNLPNTEILLSDKNRYIAENLILGNSQLVIRNILHPWCEFGYRRETKTAKLNEIRSNLNNIIDEQKFESNYTTIIKPYIENIRKEKFFFNENKKRKPLEYIEQGLLNILNQKFDFKSYEDPTKTSSLSIKNSTDKIEISQLGSGTINVLNILSVLEYNNQTIDKAATKCNVLLLDEPDSHLHSNLQIKLFNHLKKESEKTNTQIFIITHNSNLISQFEKVVFFQKDQALIEPIDITNYLENHLIYMDHNQYEIIKQLSEAKQKTTKLENILAKSNEIVILFEGKTDIKIFKVAFEKLYKKDFPFTTKDEISSAGQICPAFNAHNTPNGFLIGVFDNDHTGRTHFKNINKSYKQEGIYKSKGNALAMLLPISEERKEYPFYKHNFTIEYLFSDDSLKTMGVELYQDKGESYKKIRSKDNKEAYSIHDTEKQKISDNCDRLDASHFKNFKPIFEKIFKFTRYKI